MSMQLVVVPIPTILLADKCAEVRIARDLTIRKISGSLRVLTAGTFTLEVRRGSDNDLITTLSWSAPGVIEQPLDYPVSGGGISDESIVFGLTGLGLGASDCVISMWHLE